MQVARSVNGVPIRLTYERWYHIVENHDELASYFHDVLETIGRIKGMTPIWSPLVLPDHCLHQRAEHPWATATMKKLPKTKHSLVVRTDFLNEPAWRSICEAIREPQTEDGFQAHVDFRSDPEYDGLTTDQLIELNPKDADRAFFFVVDRVALTHPEHPILVIDLYDNPGRVFRVIPSEMWGVENNLSIANMDFFEFADNVDEYGVFRDFPEK